MIRIAIAALCASFALSGIAEATDAQPRPARAAACAPVPAIALLSGFDDRRARFVPGPFRATLRNLDVAWRRSCANGLLRGVTWRQLFLRNAPDANVASIYRDPDARSRLTLEYPFVTADGVAHVPTADDLAEAIYCHVRGATPQEQEESGRCLPD